MVLVDCKRWKSRVRVGEVLVLASRASDIRAKNPDLELWVSLLSTKGASKNAQILAKYFDIKIETVQNEREYAISLREKMNIGRKEAVRVGLQEERPQVVRINKSK